MKEKIGSHNCTITMNLMNLNDQQGELWRTEKLSKTAGAQ